MTAFVPPFKVHVCWFASATDPRCAELAREIYEYLHRPLDDDFVLRPGVEIPVEVGRELGGLLARLEADDEPKAGTRLVIALLDAGAFDNPTARTAVERAVTRWTDARRDTVFLPILLDRRWAGSLSRPGLRAVAGIPVPVPCPKWSLVTDVGIVAGRALLRRLHDATPPRAKVFISHARTDGAEIARRLHAYMNSGTRVEAWLDATDIERGEELRQQLESAARDGVLLVVRTDHYSESPWCGLELLAGKRARVPIVTLLAGTHGEPSTSAYGGNHRTITWQDGRNEREAEIVARCVQAWLHGHYFRQYAEAALALAGLPSDAEILTRRPELLDIADNGATRRLIVHPDPPLTDAEATVLRTARPSVRLATPTTLFGRVLLDKDPEPPLSGTTVAYSLSDAEELPTFDRAITRGTGLTDCHLQDVLNSIVVTTVHSGARIAYGGDFRRAGFSQLLSDLLLSRRRLGSSANTELLSYLRPYREDPSNTEAKEEIEYSPVIVEMPAGAAPNVDDDVQQNVWHLAMREAMAESTEARILLGGKTRPRSVAGKDGYSGPWPGVLEEACRTLRRNRGLFVIGGFSGAAGSIADMLRTGTIPKELRRETWPQLNDLVKRTDAVRASMLEAGVPADVVLVAPDGRLLDIEDLARCILEEWQQFVRCHDPVHPSRWTNGLTKAENERLFVSTDRTEITHLVFEGLRRLARSNDPALKFAAYLGDIALVPEIDGYAVTITPGVPPMGASVALDKRMGGRLAAISQTPTEPIMVVPSGGELTGQQVLVVQLDLAPAGQTISSDAVGRLAERVAHKADQLGITSIACAAFASTMGLPIGDSVTAMRAGFERAKARALRTVVFCETSGTRYRELRAALGSDAVELRAGPVAKAPEQPAVLHIEVSAVQRDWRVRSTMFALDNNDAIVPHSDLIISEEEWRELRRRSNDIAVTLKNGKKLWNTLLSEEIRTRLAQHPSRRLVVLTGENGAGLPWEFLTDNSDNRIACQRGVVRRIALTGAAKPPDAEPRPDRRVLLVVDPHDNLPRTRVEADDIQKVLRDRPDIEVTRLDGPAATLAAVREQLATGDYDIFHYAGHAEFHDRDRAKSGLLLAGNTVLTAAQLPDVRPPRFVYLSGCESVRMRNLSVPGSVTEAPNGQALAEALLRQGVSALVGTFFAVEDGTAQAFASETYRRIAAGQPLGDAVREARAMLDKAADWGNFMVYGDDQLII
jgi:hypothetical protein